MTMACRLCAEMDDQGKSLEPMLWCVVCRQYETRAPKLLQGMDQQFKQPYNKQRCCMMPYNFKGTAIQLYAMWHGKLCHYLDNGTVHRSQLYVLRKLVNNY